VPLGFTFPMPGVAGLTHIVVGSNGEVYLTSGGAAVSPVNFGITTLTALRSVAGGSPRIVTWGQDLDDVGPGAWDIKLDQTATTCKVSWQNVGAFFGAGDDTSFSVTLDVSGVIQCSYSSAAWPVTNPDDALVGVSIGNAVGTGTELPVDLSAVQDSGALGLAYETFPFGGPANDLAGMTVTFVPNGVGGYQSQVTCTASAPVLSAAPAPTFTLGGSSVPMTWQVDNLRDASPSAPGVYLGLLIFSATGPIGGTGIDLTLLGLDAPGCTLYVGSIDVTFSLAGFSPSIGQPILFPQPLNPGETFYSQVANFIVPNSLPSGLNNFGVLMTNGLKSVFQTN
jgi:hypothetical protein